LNKIATYSRYLFDYLKFGEYSSVIASLRYVLLNKSHSTDRIVTTSIGKFFCRKNTNDFQFANYYYEWGVKKYILNRQKEFSVFIDAGACVGDYSILMAKLDKRCFAFELVSDNINTFRKNIELNQLQDKIKLFPYGLGDADYSASFNFDPVNTGASRINRIKNSATEKAEIRKLDSLMDEMAIDQNERIFIKLDVEGMEAEAIRGAFNFITYYPHITFIVEDIHSGQFPITDTFSDIALFEFGKVDDLNIYAKKIRNY
jgi:FkbM family methyltransferase